MSEVNGVAEKLLLSSLIRHPDNFFKFCDHLDENDFSFNSHKAIFQVIHSLYLNKEATSLSKDKINAEAKSLGLENFQTLTNNGKLLDDVFAQNVTPDEATNLYLDVKRCTLISYYKKSCGDLTNELRTYQGSISDLIALVEDRMIGKINLLDKGEHAIAHLGGDAKSIIDDLANDPGSLGIDIGFPVLQDRIGQIRNGSISLFVGNTKCGKSQLGARAALNTAFKYNLPCIIADSELNQRDQTIRLVGMFAEVPYFIIETGLWKLSEAELKKEGVKDEDLPRYLEYGKRMSDPILWDKVRALPIDYIPIYGLGVEAVLPRLRQWLMTKVRPDKNSKHPQCLIIYDYLKLANKDELGGGKFSEWQIHGLNVARLHEFAQKYNVPILTFGQTNKEIDTDLNCIAGAKRIVENVESATLMKLKTEEERSIDGVGSHYVRVFCARYGKATPIGHINFQMDLGMGQMTELGFSPIDFQVEKQRKLDEWKKKRFKKDNDDDDDD